MDIERIVALAGYLISLGLAVDLFYIFLRAYLNGGTIVINVNEYGEANMEVVLISIVLVFCGIGLYYSWRYIR